MRFAVGLAGPLGVACCALIALFGASVLPGCTRAATQLVVVVDSDLPAEDVVAVRALVRALDATPGEPTREERWQVPAEVTLPFSFGIVAPGGDARRRVTLDVEALRADGQVSVRRRIRTGFLPGQSLRLPVFLAASCRGEVERCEASDETCVDGRCVGPDVAPETLETVEPGSELADAARLPDAGPVDVGAVDAGAVDAGARDVGVTRPDAGVTIPDVVVPVSVTSFGADAGITAIAFGPDGDVYVGGSTSVAATFFGTPVQPGLVIARLDADGTPVWVRSWLATDQPAIEAVHVGAIDSAMPVGGGLPILLVLGRADATAGVTEATGVPRSWSVTGMTGYDEFLAAVSVATGDVLDVLVIDGAGDESVTSFAGPGTVVQRGDDIVVETFSQSGSAPYTATSMMTRAFSTLASSIAPGSPARAVLFSTRFAGDFIAPSGRVTGRRENGALGLFGAGAGASVVGGFGVEWPSGRTTVLGGVAATDIVSPEQHFALHAIAGLSPTLGADWVARVSIRVTSVAGGWPLRTAIASGGGLVWAATARGSSTAGEECLSYAIDDAVTMAPGTTGCAALTAYTEDGTPAVAPILLGRAQTYDLHLAADLAGNVYEAGRTGGSAELGVGQAATAMPAGGGPYVSSHSPAGAYRWSYAWSSQYSDVDAIAVASNGDVWLAGSAFAGFTLTPSALRASTGGFLVRLSSP